MVPCQRSGRCCQMLVSEGALDITDEDIQRWEVQGRDDILQWVSVMTAPNGEVVFADFPVHPDGKEVERCPFLAKEGTHFVCSIHETKPTVCAEFHCVTRKWPEGAAYQLALERKRSDGGVSKKTSGL